MERVLVSACLLGEPVRYNGGDKLYDHEILNRWRKEGRVVPVCPEVAGGLPVPRPPAEILSNIGESAAQAGALRVVDANGNDVTAYFVRGAEEALHCARSSGIRVAVLKEGSPSCGSGFIYDGTFTSTRVPNLGVTASVLRSAGVHVFSEHELPQAEELLRRLEAER